ncbi:hypothetical protein FRC19_001135 [Serendipita sp. 401]|nr:hypothetical protein FRC19_001135 [Serendipita sp. 401]KAG8837734.1 hypothetical protein FRC18_008236 [Serendipita sp. 400]KAG9056999.1 hypothetical protein FS842_008932 [Serendipita sp. 407]
MEPTISELAQELLEKSKVLPDGQRYLVGLSGIPASGKSSLAHAIVNKLNQLHRSASLDSNDIAIVVGLDGWHLPRSTLAAMTNAEEAFARRGAHWTFSGTDYVSFVQRIRESRGVLATAPSFSHSTKDPVEDDIQIYSHLKIILIEGLYVFLSIDPWRSASELLDERWFVEVDINEAKERIVKRHVETGVTLTMEQARERAEQNDFPNGDFVITHMLEPTKIIRSVNDSSIAI